MDRGRIIVMLGAPGVGKGTQAKRLGRAFGIPQISTGDILRDMAKEESPLGRQIREIQSSGKLVSDEVLAEVVRERTSAPDCASGYILDGYPRTLVQAEQLDRLAEDQDRQVIVLNIEVPGELLFKRLTGRRVCKTCGAIFNIYLQPPREDGVCDNCSSNLTHREDDRAEVIEKRLEEYHKNTAPLVAKFRAQGILYQVDGSLEPANVFEKLSGYIVAKV